MKCAVIDELGYSEFSERIHSRALAARTPINGSIELTDRCNLACVHCFIGGHGAQTNAEPELSTDELYAIIDQLVDRGCLWLLLTGGECFRRPDFIELYTHAKKRGLLLTVFTNGTLMTERIADHLSEYPPFAVEISFYGRSQETYERVTGVKGSYDKCLRAIALCLERNLPLKLKTTVMAHNRHELDAIRAYAYECGVEFRYDAEINPAISGNGEPERVRLSPAQVLQLDLDDPKRTADWIRLFGTALAEPKHPNLVYQCSAGLNTFHIDSRGRLSGCLMARQPGYDLRRGTFDEGWNEFMPAVIGRQRKGDAACAKCRLLPLCGQCPGWSQLAHGGDETAVEFLCELAQLRADTFGEKHAKIKRRRRTAI